MIETDETTADIEEVLKNNEACDEWANAVRGSTFPSLEPHPLPRMSTIIPALLIIIPGIGGLPQEPGELLRGIQKFSSQPRYINNLLRYAVTPEALTDFQCLLSITDNPVEPVQQVVTIPDDREPAHLLETVIMPLLPMGVDQDDEITR